jgi:hypothetical protein
MVSLLANGMSAATNSTPDSIRVAIKTRFRDSELGLVLAAGIECPRQFGPVGSVAWLKLVLISPLDSLDSRCRGIAMESNEPHEIWPIRLQSSAQREEIMGNLVLQKLFMQRCKWRRPSAQIGFS